MPALILSERRNFELKDEAFRLLNYNDQEEIRIIEIEDKIVIKKESSEVWRLLVDVNNWGRWSPVIDHAVIYGPPQKGTAFKCNSGKWEFDCRITEAVQEQIFECTGKTIGFSINIRWELTQNDSNTEVKIFVKTAGWLVKIFKMRFSSNIEFGSHRWLSSLKSLAEKGKTIRERSDIEEEAPERSRTVFTSPFSFITEIKKSRKKH